MNWLSLEKFVLVSFMHITEYIYIDWKIIRCFMNIALITHSEMYVTVRSNIGIFVTCKVI